MRRISVFVSFCILGAALGQAAKPEATVISGAPFRLHGVVVPVTNVKAWPLLPGDEVATDRASAAIRFADGTSITLQPSSVGRFEKVGDHAEFHLVSGDMDILPAAGSRIAFYSQTEQLQPPIGQVTRASAKATSIKGVIVELRARVPPPPGVPPLKSNQ